MTGFTISQLARFAGIKAHTIRAWEIRYQVFKPYRTSGNVRFYSGSQISRLLDIISLADAGYKVSLLCGMPDEKLCRLLEKYFLPEANQTNAYFISQLIAAGMTYDEIRFEKVFARCVGCKGLKAAYVEVLLPMLHRIGLLWKCNKTSSTHEHFISNILRQKLFSTVENASTQPLKTKTWLLFLPANEFHELGLLLARSLIRFEGHKVIYLGADVPWDALCSAVADIQPDYLLFFLVHNELSKKGQKYLSDLNARFTTKSLFIAGNTALIGQVKTLNGLYWLRSVEDLSSVLAPNRPDNY